MIWVRAVAVAMATILPSSDAVVQSTALADLVSRSYLDLLEVAPGVTFSPNEFEALRKELAE